MKSGIFFFIWLFLTSFLFGDDSVVMNPVNSILTQIQSYVSAVLASIVAITLMPYAWYHVYNVLFRVDGVENRINSTPESRAEAMERLEKHGIGEKELNLKSYRNALKANKFRKKFRSFEDWQDSSDFRKSHN